VLLNRAYEYLSEAAELGHVPSMEKVAFALLYGNHMRQNVAAAKTLFEKLAMLGCPHGQLVIVYVASILSLSDSKLRIDVYYRHNLALNCFARTNLLRDVFYAYIYSNCVYLDLSSLL